MKRRFSWLSLPALLLILLAVQARAQTPENRFANPSFELGRQFWTADKAGKTVVNFDISPEQAADMAEVQAVYHAATSNDIAAAYSEKKFNIFNFTPAIGDFFVAGKFPKTEAFFDNVQKDAETVTDNAKDFYKRPRPYVTDPSLINGKLEKSFSYPSGHSTESMVLALVLSDLFPDKHDAIIAKARSIGWHRVQTARHYPTDIYAGRVLAQAIVKQM